MKHRTRLPLFALGALWLATGCNEASVEETAIPIRTVRAMRVADLEGLSRRSFPGRAEATQEIDLAFRVSGPLVARPVSIGDEVEKGKLIARIDPRDFEVDLRNAQGSLQRAEANEQRALSDYERNLEIQQENPAAISQARIDQSKEALDVARADIAALEASVAAAKNALNDTDLTAPFSGTVVATYVENFQNVREKQKIVRLLDNSRIEFTVNIPESLISLIDYTREVTVVFDAFPDVTVSAEIHEVGNEASEITRTFPVTLIMDQPENVKILPGMAGRASGSASRPSGGGQVEMVVPVTAVFSPEDGDKNFVWVIDPSTNIVKRREVQLGTAISGGYIVDAGLQEGELIATAGVHFLNEDQEVRPSIQ